jgi:hypothetical protein
MSKFKQVEHDEFIQFISKFPMLKYDVTGICEPPMGTYNDFIGGKIWPDSVVAKVSLNWLGPNGEVDNDSNKYWKYYIKEN